MNVDEYLWVEDPEQSAIAVAGCVTIVSAKRQDEVLRAFGADPDVAPRIGVDAWEWEAGPLVAPVQTPGAVVLIENNEYQGSRVEVLRALSRAGTAFSIFWNVNAHSRVSFAEDGEVIVGFEALFPDQRDGAAPDRLLPLVEDLPFGHPGHPIAAAFALAERVTGVRITPELIRSARETWLVEPLLDDLPAAPGDWTAEHHPLRREQPDLFAQLNEAGDQYRRQVAGLAARHAAAATGLDRESVVADALRSVSDSAPLVLSEAFGQFARRVSAEGDRAGRRFVGNPPDEETYEAWRRVWAVRAIRAASGDHALAAALGSVYSGLYALARSDRQRAELVEQIRTSIFST